jgi:hypothetical protein
VQYEFSAWSNGPTTAQQIYNVPETNSALTAVYVDLGPCAGPPSSGLVMRLHTEVGLVLSGSNVVLWQDQSGSANDLTAQGNPVLLAGAANGVDAVHFDGVDDALGRSGFTGLPTGAGERTVFMVARYNAANANGGGWAGFAYGTPSANRAFGPALTPTGTLGVQGWGGANDFESNPPTDGVGGWLSQSVIYGGGTVTQFRNGVGIGSRSHSYNTGTSAIRLGEEINGGKNLNMDVAEVLVYDRALSEIDRQQIESYIQQRYSIVVGGSFPVVAIDLPEDGSAFMSGAAIEFQGSANDAEEGDLSGSLSWSSSLDGLIGTGTGFVVDTLSAGTHVITASVTDSNGMDGSDEINVTVTSEPVNSIPVVSITSPADESVFTEGAEIQFAGTADDAEDGDLSGSIQWNSDLDGFLGTGAGLSVSNLSVGVHTITAAATDTDDATGTDGIEVVILSSGGGDPGELLTDNLVVQLEADLNVSLQSGTTVAGWLDQSGLGNDLVAGGDPQLIVTATPLGMPAIRFDGNGDKLERINATDPLGGLPAGNGDRTLFMVAKYDAAAAWGGLAYGNGLANQAFGLTVKSPSGELVLQGYSSGNDLVSTTPGIGAGWLVRSAVLNGGTGTLYKDGAQIAQWVHDYNTVLNKLVIAQEINDNGYVTMDVAAVLIYDRALNESERASVENYLQSKYLEAAPANTAPVVNISSPADESVFTEGTEVQFTGTAEDTEDGDLGGSIQWSSDRDGILGTGATIATANLSVGTHGITASVTDSGALEGSDSVSVTIEPVLGQPELQIAAQGTNVVVFWPASFTSYRLQTAPATFGADGLNWTTYSGTYTTNGENVFVTNNLGASRLYRLARQ